MPSKLLFSLVPAEGIEPPTFGLQNRCRPRYHDAQRIETSMLLQYRKIIGSKDTLKIAREHGRLICSSPQGSDLPPQTQKDPADRNGQRGSRNERQASVRANGDG